jgi:hypothetical protein
MRLDAGWSPTMTALEELKDFHRFLNEKIQQGSDDLTPSDALEEWALAQPDVECEVIDTVAAIREAIEEMDSGAPGIPLDAFVRKFEAKHGLKSP